MRILLFLLVFLLLPGLACAQMNEGVLTPAQTQRADHLESQLRCLVCQNESIEESLAPLAGQLRQIIRQQIVAGDSDQQIKHYMVQRYGIFILLKPPLSPLTWLLYAAPVIALLVGAGLFYLARRQGAQPPLALSKPEQDRLDELLK